MLAVTHDTNWFYSTLAQSAAAIVGLAGGFLVSRLLTRRAEVAVEREPLRQQFTALLVEITSERRSANAAVRSMEAALARIEERPENPPSFTSDELRPFFHELSYWSPPNEYGAPTTAHVDALRGAIQATSEYHDALPEPSRLAQRLLEPRQLEGSGAAAWLNETLTTDEQQYWGPRGEGRREDLWETFEHQRGLLKMRWRDRIKTPYNNLSTGNSALRGRLIPRSMYFLLIVLTFLVGTCVAVPMFFLTAESGASKGLLIAAFSVAGAAFVGYLFFEVDRINRAADLSVEWF